MKAGLRIFNFEENCRVDRYEGERILNESEMLDYVGRITADNNV